MPDVPLPPPYNEPESTRSPAVVILPMRAFAGKRNASIFNAVRHDFSGSLQPGNNRSQMQHRDGAGDGHVAKAAAGGAAGGLAERLLHRIPKRDGRDKPGHHEAKRQFDVRQPR
jgi:hypothetical protein